MVDPAVTGAGGDSSGSSDDGLWAALTHAVSSDWTLTRYVNSCYPVVRRTSSEQVCTDETKLIALIRKTLAATGGVESLRLQVMHRRGDAELLVRLGEALAAKGVRFHPTRYTHVLSVVHVQGALFPLFVCSFLSKRSMPLWCVVRCI